MIFWQGLGGNGPAQRPPGHHTIQSPRTDPHKTSWGTISSTKSCFSGPHFGPKKVPGPAGVQIWDPGSPKWSPGMKIPKLRTEKPCRIQWSVFQTEPYVASYGLKPSWTRNAKWCKCDLWAYGLLPPARILGSGQISTGASLPRSSQPPILPETCSTPGLRPGIRPRQKRPGRILGLEYGVEQFSAVSNACSTQAKMPGSSRNLPWLNSARPWSCCPVWYRCGLELFAISIPLLKNLPPATLLHLTTVTYWPTKAG
jgi:hypothetical protein